MTKVYASVFSSDDTRRSDHIANISHGLKLAHLRIFQLTNFSLLTCVSNTDKGDTGSISHPLTCQ